MGWKFGWTKDRSPVNPVTFNVQTWGIKVCTEKPWMGIEPRALFQPLQIVAQTLKRVNIEATSLHIQKTNCCLLSIKLISFIQNQLKFVFQSQLIYWVVSRRAKIQNWVQSTTVFMTTEAAVSHSWRIFVFSFWHNIFMNHIGISLM